MSQREFDRYSDSYDELLKDPIRDYFSSNQTAFFHTRKRDVICEYFRHRGLDTRKMCYLDLGCGKGDLLRALRSDFGQIAGCDPSQSMLASVKEAETQLQRDEDKIPFPDDQFDFITAAAVYHHVVPQKRAILAREARRVLKPGGVFAIIEHNPFNPVTRLIVSRTPVDEGAILLKPAEAAQLMLGAGLEVDGLYYFLYFPKPLYERGGKLVEKVLTKVPLGGQYVVFGNKRRSQCA